LSISFSWQRSNHSIWSRPDDFSDSRHRSIAQFFSDILAKTSVSGCPIEPEGSCIKKKLARLSNEEGFQNQVEHHRYAIAHQV
jgi:hypothetical protein